MSNLNLCAKIKMANKDVETLNKIIDNMSKEVSMIKFSEYMCSICPYMCDDCDFCFMIFKYNIGKEHYKKIIKKLIFSFYYGLDVSTPTFLNYYICHICPICAIACKDIGNNNDCPYGYLKQFNNYKPMFSKPVCTNYNRVSDNCSDCTTIKFDHRRGILVIKRPGSNQYKPLTAQKKIKPHISIKGKTMTKIINNLWGLNRAANENNSQTWNNNT